MILHKLLARFLKHGDDPEFYLLQARDAIRWLEESVAIRSHLLVFLNVDPRFDELRSRPEFTAITEQVGL